jgi:hypothetical protein
MRRVAAIVLGFAVTAPIDAGIHSVAPGEIVQTNTISVTFDSGDSASFHLSGGFVDRLDFNVLKKPYSVSLAGCKPVQGERAETASLSCGSEHDQRSQGTFTILVSFGVMDSVHPGQLPQLQISFANGKLAMLLAGRGVWAPLCSHA